jgi:hypothetical protein
MAMICLSGCYEQNNNSDIEITYEEVVSEIDNSTEQNIEVEESLGCVKQPIITEDQLITRDFTIDEEERKLYFQDASEITIQFQNIKLEQLENGLQAINLEINAFFWNDFDEPLIVYVPPGASNYLGTMGLWIDVIDNNGNNISNLDGESYDAIFPTIASFVMIPVGEYHCETYTLRWLVSEDGMVPDESGNIVQVWNFIQPGKYQIRATYINNIYSFGDFDVNPYVGMMVSNWIDFEIP